MRVYCKKAYGNGVEKKYGRGVELFKKGEWYIGDMDNSDGTIKVFYSDKSWHWFYVGLRFNKSRNNGWLYFKDYFYTEKELRLLKLEQLGNEGIL